MEDAAVVAVGAVAVEEEMNIVTEVVVGTAVLGNCLHSHPLRFPVALAVEVLVRHSLHHLLLLESHPRCPISLNLAAL